MVAVVPPGVVAGAVYVAIAEDAPRVMVPKLELPLGMPATSQVTFVFVTPVTVAVNCCWPLVDMVAEVGERDIVTGVTDMVAVAVGGLELVSKAEPAVMVTGETAVGGAV